MQTALELLKNLPVETLAKLRRTLGAPEPMDDAERQNLVSTRATALAHAERKGGQIRKRQEEARAALAAHREAEQPLVEATYKADAEAAALASQTRRAVTAAERKLRAAAPPCIEETRTALVADFESTRRESVKAVPKNARKFGGLMHAEEWHSRKPSVERRLAYISASQREIREEVPFMASVDAIEARCEEIIDGLPAIEWERVER